MQTKPTQLSLFDSPASPEPVLEARPNLDEYDYFIVADSGGKDSLACILHLLEEGVPREKIELWHHDVDGRSSRLMDWPITRDYCRKVADHLGLPIYFSWKEGGFEREMLRDGQRTAPISFETPSGEIITTGGEKGTLGTRRKFPQVSADLRVRWCSAYLKVDVCSRAIRNQDRFHNKKTLLVTGERAEESAARAKYNCFGLDQCDTRKGKTKRQVDRWRPIHQWDENAVWAIIARWKINPHPAYHLGWGRVSCAACIFGNANQWASLAKINPAQVEKIAAYEKDFGFTIHRSISVPQLIAKGTPYSTITERMTKVALGEEYHEAVVLDVWSLPAGAFGENAGPT